MICVIIAVATVISYYGTKARQHEYPNFTVIGDFTIRHDEIISRRNELDKIEIEIEYYKSEMRIKDDLSPIRNRAYEAELERLNIAKDRHILRLEEIEY
jgi:hypothetical protein